MADGGFDGTRKVGGQIIPGKNELEDIGAENKRNGAAGHKRKLFNREVVLARRVLFQSDHL